MKGKHPLLKLAVTLFSLLLLLGLQAGATVYSVKAGGGGNYTSISACATAAKAGDTCVIYAGSYSGWSQSSNGSSGNPITFTANSGDTVTVTSSIDLSSRSYIKISYLNVRGSVTGNGSTHHNVIDHNTFTDTGFRINDGQGNGGSDNVISNNTVAFPNRTSGYNGFYVYGDRNRFENNTIHGGGRDCFGLGGDNVVVRNNYCYDEDGSSTGEHIDFVQVMGGGTVPTLRWSLIEGNVFKSSYNQSHSLILRNGSGAPDIDGIIYRFNYNYDVDSGITNGGGTDDHVINTAIYNNTFALERTSAENGYALSCWGGRLAIVANNIAYKSGAGGWSPTGCAVAEDGALLTNGTLAFIPGFSGTYNYPYSAEATYNTLRNKDPMFANYPTDASLKTGSPAIGAGVALAKATNSGSNSTSLVITNIHAFQPGWAGVSGDCIRVGSSAKTCITAMNYSTNTVTVSPAISWSTNDPVNLEKDTTGRVVLNGTNPDIGAARPNTSATQVAPPTNVQAVAR
jgi:hypothetical protein